MMFNVMHFHWCTHTCFDFSQYMWMDFHWCDFFIDIMKSFLYWILLSYSNFGQSILPSKFNFLRIVYEGNVIQQNQSWIQTYMIQNTHKNSLRVISTWSKNFVSNMRPHWFNSAFILDRSYSPLIWLKPSLHFQSNFLLMSYKFFL